MRRTRVRPQRSSRSSGLVGWLAMGLPVVLAWRRADEHEGHSLARLESHDGGWRADGQEILAGGADTLACSFSVLLDADWQTLALLPTTLSREGTRTLELRADRDRRWRRNGAPAPELDGCIDVDVAATPLTNTFPIRRLAALGVGQQRTSPVAWVEV